MKYLRLCKSRPSRLLAYCCRTEDCCLLRVSSSKEKSCFGTYRQCCGMAGTKANSRCLMLWSPSPVRTYYPSAGRFLQVQEGGLFTPIVYRSPEILLIGTGKSVKPLPAVLRRYLNKLGIQVDVMDSVRTRLYFGPLSD